MEDFAPTNEEIAISKTAKRETRKIALETESGCFCSDANMLSTSEFVLKAHMLYLIWWLLNSDETMEYKWKEVCESVSWAKGSIEIHLYEH